MAITASAEGGSGFKAVAPGTYVARCISIVDIGTQHTEWQGESKRQHQVIISWELPTEKIEDGEFAGKPHIVGSFYTLSLGEKANLRRDLESWRSRPFTEEELGRFDLKNILGKPCMLSVIHNTKGKAKVSGVMSLPKGMTCPPQITESLLFDLSEFNQVAFERLTKGVLALVEKSEEYQALFGDYTPEQAAADVGGKVEESEIPF